MINIGEIYNFFLIGIPESIALASFTIIILRLPIIWKYTIYIGLFIAITVLFLRTLMLSTGIHSAAAVITTALLVSFFYKFPKFNALIASVVCFFYLNLLELGLFFVIKYGLTLDIGEVAQNRWHWTISAWVKTAFLALTAFLFTRSNWYRQGKNMPFN